MKNVFVLKVMLFTFSFVFIYTYGQEYISRYKPTELFLKYDGVITIGFISSEIEKDLEEDLIAGLDKDPILGETFIIYPSQTLESVKEDLEITRLNTTDIPALQILNKELAIDLILTGKILENNEVYVKLIQTTDGNMAYSNKYRASINSTPIDDLVKLFLEKQDVEYKLNIKYLPQMVVVEKGEIEIGTGYKKNTIKASNDFEISKYECTINEFREFVKAMGYKTDAEKEEFAIIRKGDKDEKDDGVDWRCDENGLLRDSIMGDYPVIYVSWNDANAYCDWLSKETGETYRLPTEDEWLYSAAGGKYSNNFEFSGSNNIYDVAWYEDNSNNKIHIVGKLKQNEIGLYDMSGNVREWCFDWFGLDALNDNTAQNHNIQNSTLKITLSSSWMDIQNRCAVLFKHKANSNLRTNYLGFRVVRELSK